MQESRLSFADVFCIFKCVKNL